MTHIVCHKNHHDHPVFNKDDVEFIVFLDKRNSSLIIKEKKGSEFYESKKDSVSLETISAEKEFASEMFGGYDEPEYYKWTYYGINCYAYKVDKDYFVRLNIDMKDAIELRTNPDFIAYVTETDQKNLKVVNVPEGKKLTIIHDIIVMSDGDCEML